MTQLRFEIYLAKKTKKKLRFEIWVVQGTVPEGDEGEAEKDLRM